MADQADQAPYRDGIGWATEVMAATYDKLTVANTNLSNTSSQDFRRIVDRVRMTPNGLTETHVLADEPPSQRLTGRPLDVAIDGPGSFQVVDLLGDGTISQTRVGAFSRDRDGYLADAYGHRLVTNHGPIHVGPNVAFRGDGAIVDEGNVVGHIPIPPGSTIRSGFLESSNVDTAKVMLDLIDAQRNYETASKIYASIDSTRQKLANEVARLKG